MFRFFLMASNQSRFISNSGPGSEELLFGDSELGYFGQVSSDELFTTMELSDATQMNVGVVISNTVTWLKFAYKGKILFVAKTPLKHTISWMDLYNKGLVYGTDDNGAVPQVEPVNQITLVKKDGYTFKVRILNGATELGLQTSAYDPPMSYGSEWNALMYRVGLFTPPSQIGPNWESFTDVELRINNIYTICKEHAHTKTNVFLRASARIDYLTHTGNTSSESYLGWRPVLELVDTRKLILRTLSTIYANRLLREVSGVQTTNSEFVSVTTNAAYSSNFMLKVSPQAAETRSFVNHIGGVAHNLADTIAKHLDTNYTTDYFVKIGGSSEYAKGFIGQASAVKGTISFVYSAITASYSTEYFVKVGGLDATVKNALASIGAVNYLVTDN